MPLSAGTRLGPYEILSPIGKGGMGEVWKARDTRLNREVAIKTSTSAFNERFEREARAIAALNHPHICTLYDVGPDYLVMEYVEGAPLRGPNALDKAVEYAMQILDALQAAHSKGIVHRDLKPANILLTKSGIKLLDFGLARMNGTASAATEAPTVLTAEGTLMGTLLYMSPEQLQGHEADQRSDLFAFGCVFYEMLTGKQAFPGKTTASVIGAILERPAPSVGEVAPPALDWVLRQCLEKDPERRWQNARDVENALLWIQKGGAEPAAAKPSASRNRGWLAWALAGLFAVTTVAAGTLWLRREKPVVHPIRLTVTAPQGTTMEPAGRPAVSPDGEQILFSARESKGQVQLYLHNLGAGSSHLVPSTAGCRNGYWSPDGRSVLAVCGTPASLVRIDLASGVQEPLHLSFTPAYTSWGPNGVISAGEGNIYRMNPDGQDVRKIGSISNAAYPALVPGTELFTYNVARRAKPYDPATNDFHVASLDGKTDQVILSTSGYERVIAAGPDSIVMRRGSAIMAQRVDFGRGKLIGSAVVIVDGVSALAGNTSMFFSVSRNGALAFLPDADTPAKQLTWVDRSGKQLDTVGEPGAYLSLALSPDGRMLATEQPDPAAKTSDIRVLDLVRATSTRLTFDPADDMMPVWSPDGKKIAYTSRRRGKWQVYMRDASGSGEEELTYEMDHALYAEDWSPDGRTLALDYQVPGGSAANVWLLPLDSRKPEPFSQSRFFEAVPSFSPDGRWLAYESVESGRTEVYVKPAGGQKGKWQISNSLGITPYWRGDGKELFYESPDPPGKIMAVDIAVKDGAIQAGIPHALFSVDEGLAVFNRPTRAWAVTRDGQKFIVNVPQKQERVNGFQVILNWTSLLQKDGK